MTEAAAKHSAGSKHQRFEVVRKCELPATENEWLQVSQRFEEKWQFPHANGAIDGKHIRIKNPKHSGSEYYNYKHFYSIVLLGIVDADYNFLYVDIGGKGGVLDGGIFRNAKINEKLERKQLNIPQPSNLQESNSVPVPYMLLGDKAFAFTDFCIRPFGGTPAPGSAESVFNSSLSRARMSVEIAFGILSNTFRVLHTPMYLEPHVSRKIVMTAVHLHNFIRNRNVSIHNLISANESNSNNVSNTLQVLRHTPMRSSAHLMHIRMHLAQHFLMNNTNC